MALKVCFTIEKGGCGKSTSAREFATFFSKKGKRVLLIDLDSQCTLTKMLGLVPDEYESEDGSEGRTIYQVFNGKPISENIIKDVIPGLDFVVGSRGLKIVDSNGAKKRRDYVILKKALGEVDGKYDLIVCDTPPRTDLVTQNAYSACDGIIVPFKADAATIGHVAYVYDVLMDTWEFDNPDLKIFGILITNFRNIPEGREAVEDAMRVASIWKTRVFDTKIRLSTSISKLYKKQKSVFDDDLPKTMGRDDYRAFCEEFEKEYM